MSNAQHTPEPWSQSESTVIVGPDKKQICTTVFSDHHITVDIENGRRIVACVNACAGVQTKRLEHIPLNLKTVEMVQRIESAEIQRDELLAALKLYEQAFDAMFAQCCSNGIKDAWGKPVDCTLLNEAHCAAGSAIAKCEPQ